MRKWFIGMSTGAWMFCSAAYSQSVPDARAMALAAYSALVRDSRGFATNPAGLVGMKDWDFNASTYVSPLISAGGFVFYGFGMGKRFLENSAVALQYSPGASIEFVVPTAITLVGPVPTTTDMRISYHERFAIGYGQRLFDGISAGVGGRLIEETVDDTRYEIITRDSVPYINAVTSTFEANAWNIDVGISWRPRSELTVAAVGRNIVQVRERSLPSGLDSLHLPKTASVELGGAYKVTSDFLVSVEASTAERGSLGYEWNFGHGFTFRNGVYFDASESPFAHAVGVGVGWSYGFVELDAGYLWFLNDDNRRGTGSVRGFRSGDIARIDMNPYTSDRFAVSVKAIFGNIRESLARIESVEILSSVYPSSYEVFSFRPIGKARVRNISDKPIEAKVSFFIEKYMEAPTEGPLMRIIPGEVIDMPLTAVFSEELRNQSQMAIREGNVYVSASQVEDYDDNAQVRVLIHGKNDWDGDVHSLRYFVTPNDSTVIRYAREALTGNRDSVRESDPEVFQTAKTLFNAFSGKLTYVHDPKQSADFVQYPSETLQRRGGDCDDMTVCFSSLLNSVGISTAFVDVVPPDRPEEGHIYMLFDTGLDPKYGYSIAENPKRYVVRNNSKGVPTVWVPVETTAITRGFDEAWTAGAQEYFDDVVIGLGLIKGWVQIVDVY